MIEFEKRPHSVAGYTSGACEYCTQELPLITHKDFDVYVASGWLFADVQPLPMERVKINFCPMCGRKLKGE